jgi:hypothetical protein
MTLINKLEVSMKDNMKTLGDKVDKIEESLTKIQKDVSNMEEALKDQDIRITDLETIKTDKIEPHEKKINELESNIRDLQETLNYQENRSRKYNLLFYGVQKVENENTTEVITRCLEENLNISSDGLIIQNSHRIPKNPQNKYKIEAPEAIIVKFAKMSDRNRILHQVSKSRLPKGMSVRTDLSNVLKKKRSELAQQAYKMRRQENVKTRIIETKNDVLLQYRAKGEDHWIRYQQGIDD